MDAGDAAGADDTVGTGDAVNIGDARGDGNCVFCDIVAGHLPAAIIFEDDATVAFLDITAVTQGHTLVIPKRHSADLWAVSVADAVAVMRTVHRMAQRIRDVLAPDGLTLFQANRPAGWQDVFHLHVHLVPRHAGDHLAQPWTAAPVPLATLAGTRARLRYPYDLSLASQRRSA